ncbi:MULTISPECIES: poly(ethylene terephthalate) hydrolase family protein [Sphingobacterium]|uniref:Alpha/beta hydrolase n=1 Tax=Sphingobacterium populi TaxID=1812824 RepID=A0ABW5U866_9SPHI|nr:alpha/beta hydrolase [Sphingobacterium sp. CFCC 11742]
MRILSILLMTLILFSCSKKGDLPPVQITEDDANASLLFNATGDANNEYGKMGPYTVSTNAVRGDCLQLVGVATKVLGTIRILDPGIRCSSSFPYGFDSQFSTEVFYPANIKSLDKLPVINFVGGILSDQGHYTTLASLWASYGFIVVNSGNFINTVPTMHIFGAKEVSNLNNDPSSDLYNKVDLSKMIIAGHSAGGGATLLTSSLSQTALNLIDPHIRIIASLPIQPGPLALGSTAKAPTFLLTGLLDLVVPAWGWPQLQGNFIRSVPAWTATATTATHLSPTEPLGKNEYAGISVAWMLYNGKNDKDAANYFIGKDFRLSSDEQFVQGGSTPRLVPLRVQRNSLAERL